MSSMKKLCGSLVAIAALTAVMSLLAASSASAATSTVYSNVPATLPGNLPSLGFQATGSSEFGGEVSLAGTGRKVKSVRFALSSWGCQSGTWNAGTCLTKPADGPTKFPVAITVTLYEVGPGNEVGDPITSATKTYSVPYRPSANDRKCSGGQWYKGSTGNCFNGKLVR